MSPLEGVVSLPRVQMAFSFWILIVYQPTSTVLPGSYNPSELQNR